MWHGNHRAIIINKKHPISAQDRERVLSEGGVIWATARSQRTRAAGTHEEPVPSADHHEDAKHAMLEPAQSPTRSHREASTTRYPGRKKKLFPSSTKMSVALPTPRLTLRSPSADTSFGHDDQALQAIFSSRAATMVSVQEQKFAIAEYTTTRSASPDLPARLD